MGCIYMFWIMVWTVLFGMSACTGAALSAAYIIVYCVVAALSAYVCYYALNSGGLVGSRILLRLNGYDSLRDRSSLYIYDVGVSLI